MIEKYLEEDMISVNVNCIDWQEAIREGSKLLVAKKYVTSTYEEAIINNFKTLGVYMVIKKGIVFAHSRPEDGVNKTALSLVTLNKPIFFGHEVNDPVTLVITLATVDTESHIEMLEDLTKLLRKDKELKDIMKAMSKREVIDIIKGI